MDADLDQFFKQSKPALLPQVEIKALPTLEDLAQPKPEKTETEDDGPKKPSRREKAKARIDPEDRLSRTLFIGNLALEVCKNKIMQRALKKKFSAHGKLVSIRFRSVGFSKAMPRKVAFATKQFHEERDSVNAYIVMEKEEDAQQALKENATVFEGKHIRVDIASAERKNDTKKSIFIGNLPLNVSEEAIWEFFGTCGEISNVRIIRDKQTNLGKGFGYVTFKDKGTIELALQLADTDCCGRPIRISKCQKEGFHKETKLFKEKRKQMQDESAGVTAEAPKSDYQQKPFGAKREFQPRSAGAKREFQPRSDGAKREFQPRSDGAKRDFQPRSDGPKRDFQPRTGGAKRDFQPRTGGAKRDFQPRSGGAKRDFQPRSDGPKREFQPRAVGYKRESQPKPTEFKKPYQAKPAGFKKPFAAKSGDEKKPFRISKPTDRADQQKFQKPRAPRSFHKK